MSLCDVSFMYFLVVVLYSYAISCWIALLLFLHVRVVHGSLWVPSVLRPFVPQILLRENSHQVDTSLLAHDNSLGGLLFPANSILATFSEDLALLLVFGICCPYVAVLIMLKLCLVHLMWIEVIKRYTRVSNESVAEGKDEGIESSNLRRLDISCSDCKQVSFIGEYRIGTLTSAILVGLLLMDIAGDDASRIISVLFPIITVTFSLAVAVVTSSRCCDMSRAPRNDPSISRKGGCCCGLLRHCCDSVSSMCHSCYRKVGNVNGTDKNKDSIIKVDAEERFSTIQLRTYC